VNIFSLMVSKMKSPGKDKENETDREPPPQNL
jgi:hypothetical protein